MENNPYKNAIIIERGTTYGYGRHAMHLYDVVKEELHKILTVKEWVRRKKRDDKKKAIDEFIKKEYGYEEKN
ncbi:MAG: hypothetical protein KA007_00570 [Candidatus Pacebacteria bacterium]|nr:hypothetical protein [Candidatus Paceibacterota bacterium]